MERLKTFDAQHPDYPVRHSIIQVAYRKPIEEGGESKERIIGKISGHKRERSISMIRRNFDDRFPYNDRININTAQLTRNNWKMFKETGLPTYNTLRVVQDGSILVTDECADGSRTYGNPDFWDSLKNHKVFRSKEDGKIDNIFIELTSPKKIDQIIQKANQIADIATNNRINLPHRDPLELIVHPNGTWDLKTLDVAETRKAESEYDFLLTKRHNDTCGEYLSTCLIRTREELNANRRKNPVQKYFDYLGYRIKELQNKISPPGRR